MKKTTKLFIVVLLVVLAVYSVPEIRSDEPASSNLTRLLPNIENWIKSEDPQIYYPENLFEYINGAAEIYLAYDFQELIVAHFNHEKSSANVSVEIYDMGERKNSFGIYSVERYPDNQFLPIGIQGYTEEGLLNFLIGNYYIKLYCFGCSGDSSNALESFSQEIVAKVEKKGTLPPLLDLFPHEGKIANSEKFILKNFLGYGFLHNGFLVNYKADDFEFDCFLIEGRDKGDAEQMWKQYIEAKTDSPIDVETGEVIQIKDRYYKNIFLIKIDKYICGVMKVADGSETLGKNYLEKMAENIKKLN